MDPVSSHLLPSTFPCNLCNHLHQADRPTQVPVNLLLVDAECWWPGQLSLLSSTCPCNLFSHLHKLSFNFYAWFLLYLLFIKSTRQVSSLEKYWRQAAGCQEHFSYHCNRFWKLNIRLQSMQMSERIQGQGGMVSWQAVDCLKAERERKGAGGRPSGNCHLTSIGPTWPNLQIISSQLCMQENSTWNCNHMASQQTTAEASCYQIFVFIYCFPRRNLLIWIPPPPHFLSRWIGPFQKKLFIDALESLEFILSHTDWLILFQLAHLWIS